MPNLIKNNKINVVCEGGSLQQIYFSSKHTLHGQSWPMTHTSGHKRGMGTWSQFCIYFLVLIIQCYLKSKLPNIQAKANTLNFARENACGEMSQFIQNSKLSLVSDIFMKICGWVKVLQNSSLPLE